MLHALLEQKRARNEMPNVPVSEKSSNVSVDSSLTGSDSQGKRLALESVVTALAVCAAV